MQFPPPPRLTPLVQRLAPEKDIDGLLEDRSQQRVCTTADGIVRQEANPDLTAWTAPAAPYLTRRQVAAMATSSTVRGVTRPARTPPQVAPAPGSRQLPSPDRGRNGPSL